MGIREGKECKKGDVAEDVLHYEILVERSSTKNGVTVTIWKHEDDTFEVAHNDGIKWTSIDLPSGRRIKNEAEAREGYENYCYDNGYLPYPEAEAYYRRKGLL